MRKHELSNLISVEQFLHLSKEEQDKYYQMLDEKKRKELLDNVVISFRIYETNTRQCFGKLISIAEGQTIDLIQHVEMLHRILNGIFNEMPIEKVWFDKAVIDNLPAEGKEMLKETIRKISATKDSQAK